MEKGGIGADRTEWMENGREWDKWDAFSIEKFRIQRHAIIRSLQFLTDIGRTLLEKCGSNGQKSAFLTEKLLVFKGIITNVLTSLCFFLERYALEIRNDLIEF